MDIQQLLGPLEQLDPWVIYLFLGLSSFIENVFPPWPGDTVTVLAGFLAAKAKGAIALYFASLLLGNLSSAACMYFAGLALMEYLQRLQRKLASPWLRGILQSISNPEQLEKTKLWFQKWGVACVIFSRFSAGIRFFINIVAGITQMNFLLFMICFTLGVIIWNTLLFGSGWILRENWRDVIAWLKIYNVFLVLLLSLVLVGWWLWRRRYRSGFS